jgi:hypothetical protein
LHVQLLHVLGVRRTCVTLWQDGQN